jgi:hypothetical protein
VRAVWAETLRRPHSNPAIDQSHPIILTIRDRVSRAGQALLKTLSPGDIDDHLTKMTLLGHMLKRSKSLVECKFTIHHWYHVCA